MPLLRALVRAGHEVALVVTAPGRPKGRGRKVEPSPVEAAAGELGCAVATPQDPNVPEFAAQLSDCHPEVAVLAAYRFILKAGLLAVPRQGFINVHPSLLPRYRGAAPIQRAIMAGEQKTGVSIIQLAREVDAGDIIVQQSVEIDPDETAGELAARLAELGARLLVEVLEQMARGQVTRTAQDPTKATFAPRLTKADRYVNWHEPAERIHNLIRGLAPEPAAVCSFRGQRLLLLGSRRCEAESVHAPGEILIDRPGLVVATGQGTIELTAVKPEGSRVQTGAAFRNGHRPRAGERFTAP
ncbi:MAG: methionyl-tRNA formyltransferase [candidate division WOR-3 bacterium]